MAIRSPLHKRSAVVPDATLWHYFSHLPELSNRIPGTAWTVEYVTLPIRALYCPSPTPGEIEAPPSGLMGSIGWLPGAGAGRPIHALAEAIAEGLRLGTADPTNRALRKVLELVNRGEAFILRCEEPLALSARPNAWLLREGIHRTVALSLMGSRDLEAMNLSSLQQAAG